MTFTMQEIVIALEQGSNTPPLIELKKTPDKPQASRMDVVNPLQKQQWHYIARATNYVSMSLQAHQQPQNQEF